MKTANIYRSLFVVVTLLGLCTLGPAPIQGKAQGLTPHANLQQQDEATLQAEQKQTTVVGQVGEVSTGHRDQPVEVQQGSVQGQNVLGDAGNRLATSPTDSTSAQVLDEATARMKPEANHTWLTIVLVLAVVGASLFGVKRWADNNIPSPSSGPASPPAPKTKNW